MGSKWVGTKLRKSPTCHDCKNDEKGGGEMKLEEIGELKDIRQKKELISFGELRNALMHQTIPKLPSIKAKVNFVFLVLQQYLIF